MTEDGLAKRIQGSQISLAGEIDINLSPFSSSPLGIKDWFEFSKLIQDIFEQEAGRLSLSPERYEYSNINTMYQTEQPILETHYLILNPGNPLMRGLLGNVLGPELKISHGVDVADILKLTRFDFDKVLFRFPGVDVGGYSSFHSFLNRINHHFRDYNLVVAYLRHESLTSFRHGFDDRIGLMSGIPIPNGKATDYHGVELEPVEELEEGNLYGLEVKGGRILIAPIASCNWNLNDLDGITADEFRHLAPDEVPLKDRAVDTFHFLNGATPHYFKQRIIECFERITNS